MAFVIDGITFDVDLTYRGQVDPNGDTRDRQQPLSRYLGTTIVDYSNPDDGT